jgi:hypothetical protein
MQKQSTRALESASALTYRVSMTTYWEADKIDIYVMYDWQSPTAINNAGSGISNQCRVKSRSSHRYRVTSGSSTINYGSRFKVRFKVVLSNRCISLFYGWPSSGYGSTLSLLLRTEGFKEATMGITSSASTLVSSPLISLFCYSLYRVYQEGKCCIIDLSLHTARDDSSYGRLGDCCLFSWIYT